jgi:DNA-binding MarR family transcriptional regulator/GNAT superfamily N-acetyltransferase
VRRFNRAVTQRIGALHDQYLARGRPLGASRLLWEIGDAGADLGSIRARLELDSGYLSRLLRMLEREGLVVVEPSDRDRRARNVRLTAAGRAERAVLDRRSDEVARSLLEPLAEKHRSQLVEAMGRVERLLAAGSVEFRIEDPADAVASFCLESYFSELQSRFDHGFDPGRPPAAELAEIAEPAGCYVVAWLRGEPVGCGGIKLLEPGAADVKRMWVARSVRGLGVGRRLLAQLEREARERGAAVIRLETNRALTEAIALYRSAGFEEVAPFNDERYADHWFAKSLAPA